MKKMIKKQLLDNSPLVRSIIEYQEVCWINEGKSELPIAAIKEVNIEEAIKRLQRFAPVIAEWFPETRSDFGLIESPLQKIPLFKQAMEKRENQKFFGNWFVKSDHQLPISGSVKARGGIYEVLKFAEKLALEKELIDQKESYRKLLSPSIKSFFADFTIIVGSTGNLGLSIGIIGRKLGFQVVVHMSKDAKTWKKNKLKEIGATVIEHDADYSVAVEQGRKEAEKDSFCYFIDDENSTHLFEGYATAAYRLKEQLHAKQIIMDRTRGELSSNCFLIIFFILHNTSFLQFFKSPFFPASLNKKKEHKLLPQNMDTLRKQCQKTDQLLAVKTKLEPKADS